MTGRSMLLASALMAVSGVWAGSASAAPIRADMSLQSDTPFEQVQMRGDGGNRGSGMAGNRGGGMRSSAIVGNRGGGGNWSGGRGIRGGNFASNGNRGNWSGGNWDGRRNWAGNGRRGGWRGPAVVFGFGPSYYDNGYYGYEGYGYDDTYAYVAPGVADGDSVAYCVQRFRSYDPASGTYLGYDGLRHPCP